MSSVSIGGRSTIDKSSALVYRLSNRGKIESQISKGVISKATINRDYLQTNGGFLIETQQDRMIAIMQKRPSILGAINIVPMTSSRERFDYGRFASSVMHLSNECENPSESQVSRPDLGKATLQSRSFKAVIEMSYDAIEDSINQDVFVNTILQQLTARAATDIEYVVVNGDTALVGDTLLSAWDGMLKSATTHVYAAGGVSFDNNVASDLIKTLPSEFRSRREDMRFFLDFDSEQNARNSDANRATDYGDTQLVNNRAVQYSGIALLPSEVWPTNLGVGNNETEVILTSRENIGVGVWRDMRLEQDPDPSAQCIRYILTMRVAFSYMYEPAVAKATGVVVS